MYYLRSSNNNHETLQKKHIKKWYKGYYDIHVALQLSAHKENEIYSSISVWEIVTH